MPSLYEKLSDASILNDEICEKLYFVNKKSWKCVFFFENSSAKIVLTTKLLEFHMKNKTFINQFATFFFYFNFESFVHFAFNTCEDNFPL